jgi:hypothetical protein
MILRMFAPGGRRVEPAGLSRERKGYSMTITKAEFGISALLILLMTCAFSVVARGETLKPADGIALSDQGQQSGQFTAPDLSVSYTYTRDGGNLQLNGTIQFRTDIQANYTAVQTFQLGLALADAQGNVLEQQGLTTAYDSDVGDTINFSKTVTVPPGVASMAFTYTGQAFEAGSGGPDATNFWFYPIDN